MSKNVDGITIKSISKKKIARGFETVIDIKEAFPEMKYVLDNEGIVYGLFNKDGLIGVYVFRLVSDYFKKRNLRMERKLDGTSRDVLRLTYSNWDPSINASIAKIEQAVLMEVKENIFTEKVIGIEWRGILHYKKVNKNEAKIYALGTLFGFLVGFFFGRIIFSYWLIALCFACACCVVGIVFSIAIVHEQSIAKLNLEKIKK
ncbi:MAG: hypothetical protein KBT48_07030 [Firmicutes bacterium]|nr:hypothetical protein [Bacillota bacterium]